MAETAICPDFEAVEFHLESELKVMGRNLDIVSQQSMGGSGPPPLQRALSQ